MVEQLRTEVTTRLSPNAQAQKIRDQFVASFQGGSNYWLHAAKLLRADNKPTEKAWYACPAVFEGAFEIELRYDDPSGYEGEGKGLKRVTQDDVRRGLEVMRRDYPKRFADMMTDHADAITADAFVQCVTFGKAIYG